MELKTMNGFDLIRGVKAGSANLLQHRDEVDSLNVFPVPDGDTGTNMYLTISSAEKEAESNVQEHLGKLLKTVSMGSLMGARGNSGVILSQIFRGMAKELNNMPEVTAKDMARALKSGSDTAYKAVMKPVEGTILTVIREIASAAEEAAKTEDDVIVMLKTAVEAGRIILKKTPEMLPTLKAAGVVDSGGQGLVYYLQGFAAGIANETLETESEEATPQKKSLLFPYCMDILLEADPTVRLDLEARLSSLGDELKVVKGVNELGLHMHTARPGEVIDHALTFGTIKKAHIENLELCECPKKQDEVPAEEPAEKKKIGLVAVASGDGVIELLKRSGVDEVIQGGQTMNPSTQDILDACKRLNAEHILILPNNSNIIMAANQAKDMLEIPTIVLPTKNVTQAISAMIGFNREGDFELVAEEMNDIISGVTYGELTTAVRDSQVDGVDVKNGDCIGLMNGHIRIGGIDKEKVLTELIQDMVTEDSEIITLLYGADVAQADAEAMQEQLEAKFEDCEVELYYGGQAHYDYLISVE